MSTKEQKIQGRKAELPALCFLNLSAHFYVWVTVWVRRLTHILTHTVSAEKSKKNPRNRMISGIFCQVASIRIFCLGILAPQRLANFRQKILAIFLRYY